MGFRVDSHGAVLPFDVDVTIYDESKLMINHEGCVNTLKKECDAFCAKFVNGNRMKNNRKPRKNARAEAEMPWDVGAGKRTAAATVTVIGNGKSGDLTHFTYLLK